MRALFNAGFGAAMLLLAGCSSTRVHDTDFVKRSDVVEAITLQTVGDPGQPFTVMLDVDGVRREWSGVSPEELPLQVNVLTGKVEGRKREGGLSFRIVKGGSMFAAGPSDPERAWRFRYHNNGIEVWQ